MARKGNDIISEIINYAKSLGIVVNLGKNKARGNKGIFIMKNNNFRIDISENLPEEKILSVLVHEITHFIHYKYDVSLQKLDFIFNNVNDSILEELIKVTVYTIPKDEAAILFKQERDVKLITNPLIREKLLKRIRAKISRINRYYNSPTELFARFMEMYFTNNIKLKEIAPKTFNIVEKNIYNVKELLKLKYIFNI